MSVVVVGSSSLMSRRPNASIRGVLVRRGGASSFAPGCASPSFVESAGPPLPPRLLLPLLVVVRRRATALGVRWYELLVRRWSSLVSASTTCVAGAAAAESSAAAAAAADRGAGFVADGREEPENFLDDGLEIFLDGRPLLVPGTPCNLIVFRSHTFRDLARRAEMNHDKVKGELGGLI